MQRHLLAVAIAVSFAQCVPGSAAENIARPVLLYIRHYNAEGETRYLPDGTFKDVLGRLRGHFEIRIHSQPLTAKTLDGVNLLLIANPSDKAVGNNPRPPHFAPADIAAITRYVRDGGGIILMGNQENHNLEIEDTNKLLANFGLQFTNLYTDAKKLVLPGTTPLLGGLTWAYYTGNLVAMESSHAAKPHPIVLNDLTQKPLGGPRDQSGALIAASTPGLGRVTVITDSGWITDDALSGKGIGTVAIKEHDNWEIFLRLANWTAGSATAKAR